MLKIGDYVRCVTYKHDGFCDYDFLGIILEVARPFSNGITLKVIKSYLDDNFSDIREAGVFGDDRKYWKLSDGYVGEWGESGDIINNRTVIASNIRKAVKATKLAIKMYPHGDLQGEWLYV